MIRRETVTITVDGSGDGSGYTPVMSGRINQIRYVKTDYANGVDFTITLEATGETVWTEENVNARRKHSAGILDRFCICLTINSDCTPQRGSYRMKRAGICSVSL